jgi:Holliday junction DNA helicase RuvA
MISILIGTCEERTTDSVTILTQAGIGYELFPSLLLQSHLAPQSPQKIYIHHHITEAGQTLFGFYAPEERTLFRRLIKISGVG